MRAYEIQTANGIDGLKLVERPAPSPGPGQVLVRMRAASLNYRDLLAVEGRYPGGALPLPLVPLSDGAGEVTAVGAGVTGLRPGDRVASSFFQGWVDGPFDSKKGATALGGAIDGVLAEQVVLEAAGAVKFPDYLSFEEAATLPCAAVTTWVGLVEMGGLKAGETVLAQGTGGVSIFALQIAKALGARALLTSSSDEKLARGKELGADGLINYKKEPDWAAKALELTGGRGVDVILEVGGAETLPQSIKATRVGGHVTLTGLLTGSFGDANEAKKNDRDVRV
ncbi:MAG TPA: NAD(P)-dependent alcohol dehydrogenase, partial [Polyangiaceae bacterium]|nr:NAD(P)-dependent alcohol dehydrogenase [Polyangiaceae bacterium]